jgi:hypothetical protein
LRGYARHGSIANVRRIGIGKHYCNCCHGAKHRHRANSKENHGDNQKDYRNNKKDHGYNGHDVHNGIDSPRRARSLFR